MKFYRMKKEDSPINLRPYPEVKSEYAIKDTEDILVIIDGEAGQYPCVSMVKELTPEEVLSTMGHSTEEYLRCIIK